MCVSVCAHSCLYLFVAESLKAYPAAGKLPKATWFGEEAVGGSRGEVMQGIRKQGERGRGKRSDHLEPQVLSNIVSAPYCLSFTILFLFFTIARNTNSQTKTH